MNKTLMKFWFLRIYMWSCLVPFMIMFGYMMYGLASHQEHWIRIFTSLGIFMGIYIHYNILMAKWEKEFKAYDDEQQNYTGVKQ